MISRTFSFNKASAGCSFWMTILLAIKAGNPSGEFHRLEKFPDILGKSTWNIISGALIVVKYFDLEFSRRRNCTFP